MTNPNSNSLAYIRSLPIFYNIKQILIAISGSESEHEGELYSPLRLGGAHHS